MENAQRWYYRNGDAVAGPFDELGIRRLVASGEIGLHTLVSPNGTTDWLAAYVVNLLNIRTIGDEDPAIGPLQRTDPPADTERKLHRLSACWRASEQAHVGYLDEYENRVADAIYAQISKIGFGGRNIIGRTMGQLYGGHPYGGSQPRAPEFAPLQEGEIGNHPSQMIGDVIAGQFIARQAKDGSVVGIVALISNLARADMRDDELERAIAPEFRHVFTYALVRGGIFRADEYRRLEKLARKRKMPGEMGRPPSGLTYFEAAEYRCAIKPAESARQNGVTVHPPNEARVVEYAVAELFRMEGEAWPPR